METIRPTEDSMSPQRERPQWTAVVPWSVAMLLLVSLVSYLWKGTWLLSVDLWMNFAWYTGIFMVIAWLVAVVRRAPRDRAKRSRSAAWFGAILAVIAFLPTIQRYAPPLDPSLLTAADRSAFQSIVRDVREGRRQPYLAARTEFWGVLDKAGTWQESDIVELQEMLTLPIRYRIKVYDDLKSSLAQGRPIVSPSRTVMEAKLRETGASLVDMQTLWESVLAGEPIAVGGAHLVIDEALLDLMIDDAQRELERVAALMRRPEESPNYDPR